MQGDWDVFRTRTTIYAARNATIHDKKTVCFHAFPGPAGAPLGGVNGTAATHPSPPHNSMAGEIVSTGVQTVLSPQSTSVLKTFSFETIVLIILPRQARDKHQIAISPLIDTSRDGSKHTGWYGPKKAPWQWMKAEDGYSPMDVVNATKQVRKRSPF